MTTKNLIVGFDPSINHTGWGVVRVNGSPKRPSWHSSGVIRCQLKDGGGRYGILARETRDLLLPLRDKIRRVVVEWPTFENSARGRDLVKKKGLTKLCAVAGGLVMGAAVLGLEYAMVTAYQWKDGWTKAALEARVRQVLDEMPDGYAWDREDEWEALGVALWALTNDGNYPTFQEEGASVL